MFNSKSTLIRSKLLVPNPSSLLHRPRVNQTLEEGIERKLTLVTAPAGYGKTSALVDFAQRSPVPVCWYTASEHDRDLGLFIQYLIAATGERFSGFGEHIQKTLISQGRERLRDLSTVVGELANEILDLDTPFVLVLDNFEVLEGSFGIRDFIRRLLEVLPFNCHLVMGSRVMPDLPVAQLATKRQIVGLMEEHLRFDTEEIQDLLQLSRIEITESQAEALAANTGGWITGILLLADLLREEAETTLLDLETASTQTYSYLAKEVVNCQPSEVQHFLRISAVLHEMSPWLCREVLEIERPRALLTEIERRNLFVTCFGKSTATTYRYHDLFREFLHEQLRQSDPVRCTELHLRAARWFEQEGNIEETIHHYLSAETYPEAIELMERVAVEWFTRGRVETLLHWAKALPEGSRLKAPLLSFFQSKALTDRYNYEEARQALAHAETGLLARKDLTPLARVHNQYALLALREGRYSDTITHAQMASEILRQGPAAKQEEPKRLVWNAEAQRLLGLAYIELGRLAEGEAKLRDALAVQRQNENPYDVLNLLLDLSSAFVNQGRLIEADDYLVKALATGRRLGASIQLAGVLNELGYLRYLCGQYGDALALYEEGLALARRGGDLRWQAYISVGLADLYRDIGAYEQAESLYDAGWQIARESEPSLTIYILAARADMYRWQGNHVLALKLLEHARQLTEGKEFDFEKHGLLSVAEGITLAEKGEVEIGIDLLFDAVNFLEQREANRELASACFLLAKAHLLAGDKPKAAAELRQALALADETGTLQCAVAEGQHAKELLSLGMTMNIASCHTISKKMQQLETFRDMLARVGTEEDPMGYLEIFTFGKGQVVRNGEPIPSSEWRALSRELFFYILLHGPVERGDVGLVFWPELSSKKMARNFHVTLSRARRAVGADVVVSENGHYRIGDVDYWFDVEEFEALVERARLLSPFDRQAKHLWQQAVELYQGDFLPEIDRSWCTPKREMLRRMYIEALIGVGQYRETKREFEEAIEWYQRALEIDPLQEDIHQRVMRCYNAAGLRPQALAQYDRCREILEQELGVEPMGETNSLYRQIAGKRPD